MRPFSCCLDVALLSLVLTAVLTLLAYASPSDPAWIVGIYDNDYDNVVCLVTSSHGAIEDPALESD